MKEHYKGRIDGPNAPSNVSSASASFPKKLSKWSLFPFSYEVGTHGQRCWFAVSVLVGVGHAAYWIRGMLPAWADKDCDPISSA